jgi:hypothetical protein
VYSYYPHFKTPFLPIENYDLDKSITQLIPHQLMKDHKFILLDRFNHVFTVGMIQPHLKNLVEDILQKQVHPLSTVMPFQVDEDKFQEKLDEIQQGRFKEENIKYEG